MSMSSIIQRSWRSIADFLRTRHDLHYLFILAVVLRLIFMVLMLGQVGGDAVPDLVPDSTRYVNIGRGLTEFANADEGAIVIFGPGYGMFLGGIFFIFGVGALPVLIVQMLLSGITCLIIYRIGHELTGSKTVAYIAGLLSALSYTSISLSNIILSDMFFLFVFAAGNMAFLIGLDNKRRSYFILSGVCMAVAVLTRTMAQFWPIVMVLLVFILPGRGIEWFRGRSRLSLLRKAWWAPGIAIIVMIAWFGRNYIVHDLPALSIAGSHGIGRLITATLVDIEGKDLTEVWNEIIEKYKRETGRDELTLTDHHYMKMAAARRVFAEYPGEMIGTYFDLVWDNLNAVNELHHVQLPESAATIRSLVDKYRGASMHYAVFVLSLLGFLAMIIRRQWRSLIFLGLLYLYMVAMLGFGQWQGSRLFFPGQISFSIAVAFAVASAGHFFPKIFARKK